MLTEEPAEGDAAAQGDARDGHLVVVDAEQATGVVAHGVQPGDDLAGCGEALGIGVRGEASNTYAEFHVHAQAVEGRLLDLRHKLGAFAEVGVARVDELVVALHCGEEGVRGFGGKAHGAG